VEWMEVEKHYRRRVMGRRVQDVGSNESIMEGGRGGGSIEYERREILASGTAIVVKSVGRVKSIQRRKFPC